MSAVCRESHIRLASFKQEKIGIFFNSEDVSMATGVLLSGRVAGVQGQGIQYGAAYDALKRQERRTPEMIQIQFSSVPTHAQIRDCGTSAQRNEASTPTFVLVCGLRKTEDRLMKPECRIVTSRWSNRPSAQEAPCQLAHSARMPPKSSSTMRHTGQTLPGRSASSPAHGDLRPRLRPRDLPSEVITMSRIGWRVQSS